MTSPLPLKSLPEIYQHKTGKVSDKWESYLHYYNTIFQSYRTSSLRLLEIGVQNGGSLESWSEFFPNAELLVGCDIDPKCADLRFENPRIKVIVGDANSQEAFSKIASISTAFDIVIDDGSHLSLDILRSFINYFPLLKPGGLFIAEDTHCLFMKDFGGGLLNNASAQSFFKLITDIVNYQFWNQDISLQSYLSTFFPNTPVPTFITEGWIESIEFRNSIITIRKSLEPSHSKLGARITAGKIAQVQTWGKEEYNQ